MWGMGPNDLIIGTKHMLSQEKKTGIGTPESSFLRTLLDMGETYVETQLSEVTRIFDEGKMSADVYTHHFQRFRISKIR